MRIPPAEDLEIGCGEREKIQFGHEIDWELRIYTNRERIKSVPVWAEMCAFEATALVISPHPSRSSPQTVCTFISLEMSPAFVTINHKWSVRENEEGGFQTFLSPNLLLCIRSRPRRGQRDVDLGATNSVPLRPKKIIFLPLV